MDKTSLLAAWADKTMHESVNLDLLAFGNMITCACGDKHKVHSTEWLKTLKTFIRGDDGDDGLSGSVLRMGVKWYCPAELLKEIRYPDGIVESIKDRFLPSGLRRFWPVRYCVHKVYEMYPEVKFPNHIGTRYVYFGKGYDPKPKDKYA